MGPPTIHPLGDSRKIVVWAQKFFVLFSVGEAGLCCWSCHFVTFNCVVGPVILLLLIVLVLTFCFGCVVGPDI